jgi:hypothetical protein
MKRPETFPPSKDSVNFRLSAPSDEATKLSNPRVPLLHEDGPFDMWRWRANDISWPQRCLSGSRHMVEIELSVLVRQCLRRRLPDAQTLGREVQALCRERNRLGTSVDWRFTTEDARAKLRSLYPSE